MNTAFEVMRDCEAFGVKISASGETLKIDAPKGLPDSVKESLVKFKADIIRALTAATKTNAPQVNDAQTAATLTARLNRLIGEGVKFEISADAFAVFGVSDRERLELETNGAGVLCTLQQMFLQKHLFSHSPELLEAFQTEVHERSAIRSNGAADVVFESVAEVCAEWIKDAIEKLSAGCSL